MSSVEFVALLAAGLAAGTINTVVGSGSLITFPALLAFGYPPVTANISNNMGVLPGTISGTVAYRHGLTGQWHLAIRLGACSVIGGFVGALLLLWLPASAFDSIVPVLILVACVLIVVQPRLQRRVLAHRARVGGGARGDGPAEDGTTAGGTIAATGSGTGGKGALTSGVLVTGVYGGYFGAAQGVLLMALLGIFVPDDLQRLNALKNFLACGANGAAAVVFLARGGIAWDAAAVIAAGSIVGGQLGARVGRRLSPQVYRAVIVIVGLVASVRLVLF